MTQAAEVTDRKGDVLAQQLVGGVRRIDFLCEDCGVRQLARERRAKAGHPVEHGLEHGADVDHARMTPADLAHAVVEHLRLADELLNFRQQRLALRRRAHAARGALEKRHLEPGLQLVELLRERRLRHRKTRGGAADALFLDDHGKKKELADKAVVEALDHAGACEKEETK